MTPSYRNPRTPRYSVDAPELKALVDEFAEKAKSVPQPEWHVKQACLLFLYGGERYCLKPRKLNTTDEVFELLAEELQTRLEELGATDVRYNGFLD